MSLGQSLEYIVGLTYMESECAWISTFVKAPT